MYEGYKARADKLAERIRAADPIVRFTDGSGAERAEGFFSFCWEMIRGEVTQGGKLISASVPEENELLFSLALLCGEMTRGENKT